MLVFMRSSYRYLWVVYFHLFLMALGHIRSYIQLIYLIVKYVFNCLEQGLFKSVDFVRKHDTPSLFLYAESINYPSFYQLWTSSGMLDMCFKFI